MTLGLLIGGLWLLAAVVVIAIVGPGSAIADRKECCPHDEAGAR